MQRWVRTGAELSEFPTLLTAQQVAEFGRGREDGRTTWVCDIVQTGQAAKF